LQTEAIGIPLMKKTTSQKTSEKDFKEVLLQCKAKGIEGLVTGDICEVAGQEKGWLDESAKKSP
jgi:diphthamide synthase (EF-2-diphthine--ammonia ligase)